MRPYEALERQREHADWSVVAIAPQVNSRTHAYAPTETASPLLWSVLLTGTSIIAGIARCMLQVSHGRAKEMTFRVRCSIADSMTE